MEDTKKTPAELVADLMLDPGFVLVPQDRYEELIRAETERDVLEATIKGENSYNVERVLDAIQQARSALYRMKMLVLRNADEPEDTADAESDHRHGSIDPRPRVAAYAVRSFCDQLLRRMRPRFQKPVREKGNGFHRHRCLANYR